MRQLGHTVFTAPGDPTIVGVRARTRAADAWDDVLAVLWHDPAGQLQGHLAQGTTDPGRPGLLAPRHAAGTAIVLPGQHRGCWGVGPDYRGISAHPYPCFRQVGSIEYIRDNDRDGELDIPSTGDVRDAAEFQVVLEAIRQTQAVGMDLRGIDGHHAAAKSLALAVGPWSLACQVWRAISDWEAAYDIVSRAIPAHGHVHSYCLLDEGRWCD